MNDGEKYWDNRAKLGYKYKNERFYTITPIPYYYARRKIILKHIKSNIKGIKHKKVCDFGCGDGVYINKLSSQFEDYYFHGIDISEEMIKVAKENNKSKKITFEVSSSGIKDENLYDVVYSSAIYAHLEDSLINELFDNIITHLHTGGKFIICEQVAPKRYGGETFTRRTQDEYVQFLKRSGFKIEEKFIIDFWLHRLFFEKKIQKVFFNYFSNKLDTSKSNVLTYLNSLKLYKIISLLLTLISYPRIFRNKNRFGYVFIVAIKK